MARSRTQRRRDVLLWVLAALTLLVLVFAREVSRAGHASPSAVASVNSSFAAQADSLIGQINELEADTVFLLDHGDRLSLPGLAARVKGAGHLGAAKTSIGEHTAVLPRERDALRDALVDDVYRQFREPVHIVLTRSKIAPLDRVVEQPINRVAVVLIILSCVDATLGGDGMRPAWRILKAKAFHSVAQLCQGRRRGCASQARSDYDDGEPPLVCRTD